MKEKAVGGRGEEQGGSHVLFDKLFFGRNWQSTVLRESESQENEKKRRLSKRQLGLWVCDSMKLE